MNLPQGRTLPYDAWRARHRAIVVLLCAHAAVVPIIAAARGFSAMHTVLESAVLPIAVAVAVAPRLNRTTRTAAASFGLLSASGILVHLSGGLIEMHFHFFVMVGVVALYQDWVPFLTAIAYVLLHHGVVGALDANSVYNHPGGQQSPWKWAAIHAAFIGAMSVGCLVTWRFNEETLADRDRAETGLRQASERLAVLAEATKILNSSLEVDGVVRGLARLVAPTIADYCVLDLVDDDGSVRRIASIAAPERREWTVELRPTDDQLHYAADVEDPCEAIAGAVVDPDYRAQVAADPPRSAIVVPVEGRDGRLGTLSLATGSTSGRRLSEDDRPFAVELGHRVATAVSNARTFARQRSLAETLQHSLLPDRLPQVPGIESAARYLAGGPGVEVGGDWYDVIQLPGGRIGLAIGDVVGKGEKAAALMGHLRSALRAYGMDGRSPAEVMDRLNALLLDTGPDQMATVIYAVLDPETGTVRFVNAGHPPPLLVSPGGSTAAYLDDTRGMPIGALPGAHYVESTAHLPEGGLLVMYTDGLVEDRTNPIDEGLERLRDAVLAGPSDLDQLCGAVLEQALAGRVSHDDTAVLAVRLPLLGVRLELRVPAHPNMLAPLRSTLRRWLAGRGASDAESFEILVASGELFTNAIRHGTGSRSHFDVIADDTDGVVISVRNHGAWRERRAPIGGRGLAMAEEYADRVEVIRGDAETEVRMHRRLDATAAARS
ncbi:MAG TPA: SpoIIE family protein phosphatase [Mycobacteriales bacterium]|nr:SpoIIE family protein phosphatase [Mycobacteriales bacterium]